MPGAAPDHGRILRIDLADFCLRDLAEMADARQRARGALVEAGVEPGRVPDALVALTELMTNALRHTDASAPRVVIQPGPGRVWVGVTDTGPTAPEVQPLDPTQLGGHGLRLVEALTDRWGTHVHDGLGKTVWFQVRTAGGPADAS